ncbi:glycosyltransferase [Pseudarthrobacter sp. CC4]|uniref:glycosyltransferase n=1 Tax=Pseudarthrobacter sp. CC4 TaxID=3029190 RepID=UPI003B8C1738
MSTVGISKCKDRSLLIWSSPSTKGAGAYQLWENYGRLLSPHVRELVLLRGHDEWDSAVNPQIKLGLRSVFWSLTELRSLVRDRQCANVVTSISQSDIIYGIFVRPITKANWTIYVLGQPYPVYGQTGKIKRHIWKWLWLFSARRAHRIIAVSDYISEIISHDLKGRDIVTVYPSLKDSHLSESVSRLPSEQLRVGFVGRLSPEKDPVLFCSILGGQDEVDARIFGDGPLRPQVEGALNGIKLLGFRPQNEIYSEIDVIMMTSKSEGLPMVLVEASLTGVVPLVCDVGGCAEAIHPDNRDLLVVPREERDNVAFWRGRLVSLQDADLRTAIAARQREWAEQKFNAEINSECLAALVTSRENNL